MRNFPIPAKVLPKPGQQRYDVKHTKIGHSFRIDLVKANDKIQKRLKTDDGKPLSENKSSFQTNEKNKIEKSNKISSKNNMNDIKSSQVDESNIESKISKKKETENKVDTNDITLEILESIQTKSDNKNVKNLEKELIAFINADKNIFDKVNDKIEKSLNNTDKLNIKSKIVNEETSLIDSLLSNGKKSDGKINSNLKNTKDSESNSEKQIKNNIENGIFSNDLGKSTEIKIGNKQNKISEISENDINKLGQISGFENAKIKIDGKKVESNEKVLKQNDAVNIVNMNNNVSDNSDDLAQNNNKNDNNFLNNLKESITDILGIKNNNIDNKSQIKAESSFSTRVYENVKLNEIPKITSNLVNNLNQNGSGTARLYLQPKSLGTVFVELQLTGEMLKVNFKTEKNSVKNIIENQIHLLKDNLQNQGIKIENVDVKNFEPESEYQQFTDQNANRKDENKNKQEFKNNSDPLQEHVAENIQEEESVAAERSTINGNRIETYI